MTGSIAIMGAASSIGIRPYDDGKPRRLDLAPGALRRQGLTARLGARDMGDVAPPPYVDLVRPPGRPRNEQGVADYSRALAEFIASTRTGGDFTVVLGGDCSIVLGCLMGMRRAGYARVGLAYVDAHADFATPEVSRTGSAASMCLALAVGRGGTPLAHLDGQRPLADPADVVVIGRRDDAEPWYGQEALRELGVMDLRHARIRERGPVDAAGAALQRLERPDLDGFWIHVDADVLDPGVLPAVDSPEPGGLEVHELIGLLTPLVRHPKALGLELTIYDPTYDPDLTSAATLAALLERTLIPSAPAAR